MFPLKNLACKELTEAIIDSIMWNYTTIFLNDSILWNYTITFLKFQQLMNLFCNLVQYTHH